MPWPNLNCLQIGEALPRRLLSALCLWRDWKKLTVLPPRGEKTCHPLWNPPGDVSHKSGVRLRPFFQNYPRRGSSPSGDHVQFMCVFNFASSSVVAGPRPRPSLPSVRSCGKRFASGSRRDRGMFCCGPSTSATAALLSPLQPGMKPCQPHMLRGPSLKRPGPRPRHWRLVVLEARIGVAVRPWAALCTNLGHKSKWKFL